MSDAERQAFAEFSKAEGFSRSVECLWATATEDGERRGKLTCKPGLLASGEQISEIRIRGVRGGADVTAITSDQFRPSDLCSEDKDLSCDHLSFPVVNPNPIIIAVHTTRNLYPTWGTRMGTNLDDAVSILRKGAQKRTKLSVVTSGTAATVNVSVRVGADEASASIPIGYARWKIESGGFFSVSKSMIGDLNGFG